MRRACYIVAAAAAALAAATPGDACSAFLSPGQRLAAGRAAGTISAVALVRITRAAYTQAPSNGAHPWTAWARVERRYRGARTGGTVSFDRGHGQAACDDGLPPPRAGALWVVYFWMRAPGEQRVWLTYPAEIAFAADPTLGQFR